MKFDWTDSQDKAIKRIDSDIIVAASAGSGKTSAMIERALSIIVKGTPVTRILMLTYGEAAAAEMREKLKNKLIDYVKTAKQNKNFIIDQLDNLSMASISTFHSFCKTIVKNNFEIAGISPTFEIADSKIEDALMQKAIVNLLKEETEQALPEFVQLREMLSPRNDKCLTDIIITIYKHMATQADRYAWLKDTFDNEYKKDIEKSNAGKYIVNSLKDSALLISQKVKALQEKATLLGDKFYQFQAVELGENIDGFANCISLKDFFIEQERVSKLSKFSSITGDNKLSDMHDIVKALREEIKSYKKEVSSTIGDTSYEEAKKILKGSSAQVAELIRLVLKFDKEYAKLKSKNNLLDFADLEKFALLVLGHNEQQEAARASYDYIFIDEYQDTNYVQEKIISLVKPQDRLFVVGDVKQCIYRFRLAEPAIFLKRLKVLKKKSKAINFQDNFRSSPAILSFVNDVFSELMKEDMGGVDYAKDAAFNIPCEEEESVNEIQPVEICEIMPYKKPDKKKKQGVYSVQDSTDFKDNLSGRAEGRVIADKITNMVGRQYIKIGKEKRLIDYSDITIMFRQRSNAKGIVEELIKCDIPLLFGKFSLASQDDDIAMLVNYLKFLDNNKDDYVLLTVLRSPFVGLDNAELAEIRKRAGSSLSFSQATEEVAECDNKLGEKLKIVYELRDKFILESQYTNVDTLLRRIINQNGLNDYIASCVDGEERLVALECFLMSLKGKAFTRSIAAFVEYYNENEADIDYGSGAMSLSNGIAINTIHASKGLEYPIVILAGTNGKLDFSKGNMLVDCDLGIGTSYYDYSTRTKCDNVVLGAIALKKKKEEKEDALRLLYVALTRAKYHLIITAEKGVNRTNSYYSWLMKAADKNKNIFKLVTRYEQKEKLDTKITLSPVYFGSPDKDLKESFCEAYRYEYPYEAVIQQSIKYSVTGINNEEEIVVPSIFEEEKVMKGVDYHKIMQYICYDDSSPEGVQKEVVRLANEGIIPKDKVKNININQISRCLSSKIMRCAAKSKCLREKRFIMSMSLKELEKADTADQVVIQGTIDLVILGEKNIIVDFKYSAQHEDVLRQRYKKQLQIYKKAVESAMNTKVDKLIIYAFGSNKVIEI